MLYPIQRCCIRSSFNDVDQIKKTHIYRLHEISKCLYQLMGRRYQSITYVGKPLGYYIEIERKERENQLLKAQNLAAALQLQRNRGLLIAAVIFILLLGTLLYALYRNRQAKIKNIALLKDLNTQLQEQKEEVSRINTILELKRCAPK